ncbi:zinc finger protein-like 1 [Ambystoma mexicanum]|uniref:zinc finger protein-like 1 n=1 Tax=Ambystoma mexicanum TaxID=8296 RepID=UPI0037E7F25B
MEPQDTTDYTDWSSFNSALGQSSDQAPPQAQATYFSTTPNHNSPQAANGEGTREDLHSPIILNSRDAASFSTASTPRKIYDTRDGGSNTDTQIDVDDDKYRRRPALSWFARLLKNLSGSRKHPASKMQRCLVILVIGVISFLTLILVMSVWALISRQ